MTRVFSTPAFLNLWPVVKITPPWWSARTRRRSARPPAPPGRAAGAEKLPVHLGDELDPVPYQDDKQVFQLRFVDQLHGGNPRGKGLARALGVVDQALLLGVVQGAGVNRTDSPDLRVVRHDLVEAGFLAAVEGRRT